MEYRRLGQAGLLVSAIGLGTNAFGGRCRRPDAIGVVHRALDLGINLIDTANTYTKGMSEEILGEALRGRRHEAVLATKAGMKRGDGPNEIGASRQHLVREIEGSLRRLQTDYIDLFWVHQFDPQTPMEETLRTLDDLVGAGKIRYVGASNHAAWQLCKALWTSERHNFVHYEASQQGYSLADRNPENELIPLCRDQGLGLVAYFPLAGGILSGKYRKGEAPPADSHAAKNPRFQERMDSARMDLAETVSAVAGELGCTPAQLALAWLLRQPAVSSAIAGATRPEQVDQNAGAVEVAIPEAALARLDEASRPFLRVPPFGRPFGGEIKRQLAP